MDKQPSNWIEGMSMEVKEKRKKDVILNIVVWLGLMPSLWIVFSILVWIVQTHYTGCIGWCCMGN